MSCTHLWRPWGRKGDKERCEHCHEVFPCPDSDCGHGDCIEWRLSHDKPSTCTVCTKPIDGQDPQPNLTMTSGDTILRLVTGLVRGRTKAFHSACKSPAAAD